MCACASVEFISVTPPPFPQPFFFQNRTAQLELKTVDLYAGIKEPFKIVWPNCNLIVTLKKKSQLELSTFMLEPIFQNWPSQLELPTLMLEPNIQMFPHKKQTQ